MVGNAVPVNMAYALASKIMEDLSSVINLQNNAKLVLAS